VSENENQPVVADIEQVRQASTRENASGLRKMLREMHPAKVRVCSSPFLQGSA
jgi:hypothetical protein